MSSNAPDGLEHEKAYDLLVIGGGVGGLSTLYYWLKAHDEKGLGNPPRAALLEKAGVLGGKIQTHRLPLGNGDQCLLEAGPDSVLVKKPDALHLMQELGLGDQLIQTSGQAKELSVYDGKEIKQFPKQCILGIPASPDALQLSELLSDNAKAIAALEPLAQTEAGDSDISVGAFLENRFGKEFVDAQVEPLLAGIFSADIYEQSLNTTLPELRLMLEKHGSLMKGAKAALENQRAGASAFVSLRYGMSGLIDALGVRLSRHVHTNVHVVSVEPQADGMLAVHMRDGSCMFAQRVVVTTPAPGAAKLFHRSLPHLASRFASFPYCDTGSVYALYDQEALRLPENTYGVLMRRDAPTVLNALTVTSRKFEGRSPDSTILLRAFFGGARRPDAAALSGDELRGAVPKDIARIFGVSAQPKHCQIFRHSETAPQYTVGHLDRVADLEKELPAGVFLAGSAYRAPGIPACIADAKSTARSMHQWLFEKNPSSP